ncbi:hypothetical protein [Streptomyces sp. NPDC096324]|uniref:hypothetical protein n=1 Tax=Streptomyces sp. NPDC096324 TaxID=3366085 RepID=UPI003827947A
MATLEEIKALLGDPGFHWSDAAPWTRLEQELGVSFPADFRALTDACGPVLISGGPYDWLLAYLKGDDVMAGSSVPDRPFYEPLN